MPPSKDAAAQAQAVYYLAEFVRLFQAASHSAAMLDHEQVQRIPHIVIVEALGDTMPTRATQSYSGRRRGRVTRTQDDYAELLAYYRELRKDLAVGIS